MSSAEHETSKSCAAEVRSGTFDPMHALLHGSLDQASVYRFNDDHDACDANLRVVIIYRGQGSKSGVLPLSPVHSHRKSASSTTILRNGNV